ncbi:MAG: hypothetical protein M1819_005737 [Sarea resinae]|nr:MAG: hypothetical protein M1819_005737 [Sarea resinae]
MKFAKELEQDLVPEWRAKYLNYKLGKKKVKAVARALRNLNQTPRTPRRTNSIFSPRPPLNQSSLRNRLLVQDETESDTALAARDTQLTEEQEEERTGTVRRKRNSPISASERQPLNTSGYGTNSPPMGSRLTRYGSIIGSPPKYDPLPGPPSLELPDPALDPGDRSSLRKSRYSRLQQFAPLSRQNYSRNTGSAGSDGSAYEAGETRQPSKSAVSNRRDSLRLQRSNTLPDTPNNRPLIQRMFTTGGPFSRGMGDSPRGNNDVPLEAYRELDLRESEFYKFLDAELDKVETFYKVKEDEATRRLITLRDQLHEMRDRRLEEVIAAQKAKEKVKHDRENHGLHKDHTSSSSDNENGQPSNGRPNWFKPLGDAIESATGSRIGKNTKALQAMGSPEFRRKQQPLARGHPVDSRRDFTRRPVPDHVVPYRLAKRKLKLAVAEYYRGLELLKSYALLNRTAFRKINKKYDKTVNAHPTGRYMSEKVNKAWFVQSDVLEGHINATEDLYSRYFEGGNRKVAVGKLRHQGSRPGEYTANAFRNGLAIAAGLVLGIQGLVHGAEHLFSPDPTMKVNASYLLQIYAGYFLFLLLFIFFCLACGVWARNKINYVFVFEFDTRHNLDWRQLAELPCFFIFLLGLFLFLNFQAFVSDAMFLYCPVILIGLTVLIIFFPAPILYHRSRSWFLYSHWRLLLSGLYPVEFRDFFLGDMYGSETYSMGNIELFFCLYAQNWDDPSHCNSSHSRLLGFFSTLPGIWRALQCLRRYYDTRNAFPHLANFGKYTFTILYYMTLSLYRIDRSTANRALFILFAAINATYCSIWDLAMDWSLCNPYARYPFLRDTLGYGQPWPYYLAMVLDPILRFNWIFYAIFTNGLQHSALLSFFVALSEVCRRGMWTIFRVENEHCTNVGRFRASRDVPLPYDIATPSTSSLEEERTQESAQESHLEEAPSAASPTQHRPSTTRTAPSHRRPSATATDLESGISAEQTQQGPSSLRLRRTRTPGQAPQSPLVGPSPYQRGISRVGTIMAQAHAQDFERKRKPGVGDGEGKDGLGGAEDGSSDEDELDVDVGVEESNREVGDAQGIMHRQRREG